MLPCLARDGDVDAIEFGAFRASFGQAAPPIAFDADLDGDADALDFGRLRMSFGLSL